MKSINEELMNSEIIHCGDPLTNLKIANNENSKNLNHRERPRSKIYKRDIKSSWE